MKKVLYKYGVYNNIKWNEYKGIFQLIRVSVIMAQLKTLLVSV